MLQIALIFQGHASAIYFLYLYRKTKPFAYSNTLPPDLNVKMQMLVKKNLQNF